MTGNDIRQMFLNYFSDLDHRVVRSSSLVPANDPTLLFTNAGMNQFKDFFTGQELPPFKRATTAQKCVRAGGKHNDLDNVGYTRRHHTFFEMLGNFSFGDYFKYEAIEYAWTLLTKKWSLPKDKLYVTVYLDDDDAEKFWQDVAGVPKDRIHRMGAEDNFWQMGETGPCGPCSEIYYDFGPEAAEPGREHEQFPKDGGGRFVEIWNLVFMQYDRFPDHDLLLPNPSIDTGMGLERITAVLQGKVSNYDTDLIRPIIDRAAELLGVSYGDDARTDTALRINADHARATAFLIHDGVLPANEGRGYVLRKIMRRAIRNARLIGRQDPYLYQLTGFTAELMRPGYPEMMESIQRVARVVKDEETRYATTFQVAEKVFADEAKSAVNGLLPGAAAFKLYDTYGLALDEQEEMARERGLTIDRVGFTAEMEQQRTRARASWRGGDKGQVAAVYRDLPASEFIGRETLESQATVARIIQRDGKTELVLDRTPFYAEAGGQVGDAGALFSTGGERLAVVESTYKPAPGAVVHRVEALNPIQEGDVVLARVDRPLRESTMRNHTATHLLHAALRNVLGTHVKQAGSVVDPDRLRFDFTHYASLDSEELSEVERLMNREIVSNVEVHTDVMDIETALSTGAMALFGEKYGEHVRVVSIDHFSKELCGGTHVRRTGDIGICKVIYEGSISAGVRRIEAITGEAALHKFQETINSLHRVADIVHAPETEVIEQLEKLQEDKKALEKRVEQMKDKLAHAQMLELEGQARVIKSVRVLAAQVTGMDRGQLRSISDSLRNKWKSGIVVLASVEDSNVAIITAVTKDLTSKVHAGKLAGAIAQAVGGKGGGRPDMAEAGGKIPSELPAALAGIVTTIEGML
ncbi:MAG: alanine--tRNA ligase [Acidobacteriota bacterium]|nr:alanine--tRNA ligase [Acidobacteriota bacterium]